MFMIAKYWLVFHKFFFFFFGGIPTISMPIIFCFLTSYKIALFLSCRNYVKISTYLRGMIKTANRTEANNIAHNALQNEFLDACKNGDVETVQRLLTNPTLDPTGEEKGTYWYQEPIKFACLYGHANVVRILLQNPRVDPTNVPIEMISGRGHTEVIRLLLQDGRADPSRNGMVALRTACWGGRPEIVQLLLQDPRIHPYPIREELLETAIRTGWLEMAMRPGDGTSGVGQFEVLKLLLADPRVNPLITVEKASILKTIPVAELAPVVVPYPSEFKQLITTVDHFIEKKGIQLAARNLKTLKATSKNGFSNLPNNIRLHTGSFLSGKVGPNLQSQINQLKINYYGPKRQRTRKTRVKF